MKNIDCNKILELKKFLTNTINNINNEVISRNRELDFKDVLFYSAYKIGNNISYDLTNSHLKSLNIANVKRQTLAKRRTNINASYFKKINDQLISFLYKDNKKRFIAIDGSKINLSKKLGSNDSYKLSKNKNYSTGLISSLYDVNNKIPINYDIYKEFNERSALIDQLGYFKPSDVAIMDRGYFAKYLLKQFIERDIDVIFRLTKTLDICKKLDTMNMADNIFDFQIDDEKIIKFRVLKYKINKEDYYIGTTLIGPENPFQKIKECYKKRWTVETDFGYAKNNLSLENIQSKSINLVKQDVYLHNFILILEAYIRNNYSDNNSNFKISTTNSLNIIINKLLYQLLYKNNTKKSRNKLLKLIQIIIDTIIKIKNDRHYTRIRKKPASKWCLNAVKFVNKFKKRKK